MVIPTYNHHFSCNRSFLESLGTYCTDSSDVGIHFILAENELELFRKTVSNDFPELPITLWSLKELLFNLDNVSINEENLLNSLGKYNYQSLKKICACAFIPAEYFIVMDSENILVRECSLKALFESQLSTKTIFYDENIPVDLQRLVTINSEKILKAQDFKYWMFCSSSWFFEKTIVQELLSTVQSLHGRSLFSLLMTDTQYSPTFEAVLYNWFLYMDRHKYGYTFISLNEIMTSFLGGKYKDFTKRLEDLTTTFEYACAAVNDDTKEELVQFLKSFKIDIYSFAFGPKHIIDYCISNNN